MAKHKHRNYQVLNLAKDFLAGTEFFVGLKVGADVLTTFSAPNSLSPTLVTAGNIGQYIAPIFAAATVITAACGGYRPHPVAVAKGFTRKITKALGISALAPKNG